MINNIIYLNNNKILKNQSCLIVLKNLKFKARLSEMGLNINDKMLTIDELDKLYSPSGFTYSVETPNIFSVNNFQKENLH